MPARVMKEKYDEDLESKALEELKMDGAKNDHVDGSKEPNWGLYHADSEKGNDYGTLKDSHFNHLESPAPRHDLEHSLNALLTSEEELETHIPPTPRPRNTPRFLDQRDQVNGSDREREREREHEFQVRPPTPFYWPYAHLRDRGPFRQGPAEPLPNGMQRIVVLINSHAYPSHAEWILFRDPKFRRHRCIFPSRLRTCVTRMEWEEPRQAYNEEESY